MKTINVLLAEDDPSWKSEIRDLLTEMGCNIETASSYVDAHARFSNKEFDLVIIDLRLDHDNGNLDGYILLEETFTKGIPSIVISGHDDSANVKKADHYEALKFLSKKNFDVNEFRSIVANILKKAGKPLIPPSYHEMESFNELMKKLTKGEII